MVFSATDEPLFFLCFVLIAFCAHVQSQGGGGGSEARNKFVYVKSASDFEPLQ